MSRFFEESAKSPLERVALAVAKTPPYQPIDVDDDYYRGWQDAMSVVKLALETDPRVTQGVSFTKGSG